MVDYIDNPLEMTIQDYLRSLDDSSEGKLNSIESMLNDLESTEYPDPPEISFDNSKVFDEIKALVSAAQMIGARSARSS